MKLIHQKVKCCTSCPFVHFQHRGPEPCFGDKNREKKKDKPQTLGKYIFSCNHKDAPDMDYQIGIVEPEVATQIEDMEIEFPEWCPLEDYKKRRYQCAKCNKISYEIMCPKCGSCHVLALKE